MVTGPDSPDISVIIGSGRGPVGGEGTRDLGDRKSPALSPPVGAVAASRRGGATVTSVTVPGDSPRCRGGGGPEDAAVRVPRRRAGRLAGQFAVGAVPLAVILAAIVWAPSAGAIP